MTNRAWVGGGNNKARNPNDWSPIGAPQPGDILSMSAGTMNIAGNALRGDTLSITGGVTVNIHGTASLDLSDRGPALGGVVPPSPAIVNLANHATLFGTFNMSAEDLKISGGDHAKYINNGMNTLGGSLATINPDVLGHGSFVVQSFGSARAVFPGRLEFGGFVSGGQTVDLTGVFAGPFHEAFDATLKVDEPGQFHGTVDLHNLSIADLVGLAQADSWSYKNDMLSITSAHDRVIDRLHVVSDASSTGSVHGLSVSKTAAGDVLVSPGADFRGSLALPAT